MNFSKDYNAIWNYTRIDSNLTNIIVFLFFRLFSQMQKGKSFSKPAMRTFAQVIHIFFYSHIFSNIRYLELSISRTFTLVTSALSITSPINSFDITNPAIFNFHYVELLSRFLQRFLGLFSICYFKRFHFTHSNAERIRKALCPLEPIEPIAILKKRWNKKSLSL